MEQSFLLPPKGFRPEGEIPRRLTLATRAYIKESTYNWNYLEQGNDDVSIVCARKYEIVRMT